MKIRVKKLGDLIDPIMQFAEDVQRAEDQVDKDDTQYNRRAFVRALFAMIEGTIFFLKQTIFSTASSMRGKLHIADALILHDSTAELNSKGKSELRTKFLRLEDNILFTSHMLKDVYNVDLGLGVGTKRWDDFKKVVAIRNRITHPKSREEFVIDNEDMEMIREVRSWFCQMIADSVSGVRETISKSKKNHG